MGRVSETKAKGLTMAEKERIAAAHLTALVKWVEEEADPAQRLQLADAAYTAVAELIKRLGSNGVRGEAARELVHQHGLERAAEIAGYTVPTMRRIAWK